ncbi:MAG: VWA domain-containing protein [Verrucomicrobiia bacterium]|jgi:Flp pilus assembly protein TadG
MNTSQLLSRGHRKETGQTLIFFAIMMLMLILVVGMTVDAATIYLSKASMDKAVDAAGLTAVRNLFQGQAQATAVAQAAFTANYRCGGQSASAPALNITYSTDTANNTVVTILGTSVINTYFLRVIPRFQTFQISSLATATRAKLVMSLVVDRSGSMVGNNGSKKLPGAVGTFISFFDDNMDKVSLVSFSSTTNLNVSVRQPFKSVVTAAANALSFDGYTYTEGGLKLAKQQNDSVIIPSGENVIKVVVFFSDGQPNTWQYTWTNSLNGVQIKNMVADPVYIGPNRYIILNPSNGNQIKPSGQFYDPLKGPVTSKGKPYDMPITTFRSVNGSTKSINGSNFVTESELLPLARANEIRNANMLIFCIGLGDSIDENFLHQIANDTSSSTFNPNQPVGETIIAATANDLQVAFQQIAAKILLRLTQ